MDSTSVSLLRRLRDSASEADWLRFTKLYTPLLFNWGRDHGLSNTDASDLVQEVMTKMVVKLREFQYDPKLKFRAWLRTVTVNQARDLRRSSQRKGADFEQLNQPVQPGENTIDLFDHHEYCTYLVTRARELIEAEFDPLTWQACWKYAVEDRPASEVGRDLGLSANAVRIAKCRVLARLRKELEGLLE